MARLGRGKKRVLEGKGGRCLINLVLDFCFFNDNSIVTIMEVFE